MTEDELGDLIESRPWEAVLSEIDSEERDGALLMYSASQAFYAKHQNEESPDRKDLFRVMHLATSPMLKPEEWSDPFAPMMTFDNKRSPIPTDMSEEEIRTLGHIAPLLEDARLRARFADIAWTYGDRSRLDLALMAVDAYTEVPVGKGHWLGSGEECWKRAFELVVRLRAGAGDRAEKMRSTVYKKFVAAERTDSFLAVRLARMLWEYGRPDNIDKSAVAAHCEELAEKDAADFRLSRALHEEAARWYGVDAPDKRDGCIARQAELFEAEAEARTAEGGMIVAHCLENALAIYTSLPKKYRDSAGIEKRVPELKRRLEDARLDSLEEMTLIQTDPIDVTEGVEAIRASVSGRSALDTLARLATFESLADPEKARQVVIESQRNSISAIFPQATFSSDGRKVATSQGSLDGAEASIWHEQMKQHQMRVGMLVQPFMLAALEVVNLEHRVTEEGLYELCTLSPIAPRDSEHLWAKGLYHGINGDFVSAAFVLVPMIERMVRQHLRAAGASTITTDKDGIDAEKGLSALIVMDECTEIFGASLQYEIRALCCESPGPNLRNEIAHGLIGDNGALSASLAYAWWLCLRLVVVPVFNQVTGDGEGTEVDSEE